MTAPPPDLPTVADVAAAAARISPHIRRTPLLQLSVGGVAVWLKLEQLQVTGSFKVRGATNAVLSLPQTPSAVVAASGGNHGLGVAHAAAAVGASATVVVPDTVPDEKARRLTAAGAAVVRHGAEYAEAEAHARQLAEALDAPFVHAYADAPVVAGQGTAAMELLEATPDEPSGSTMHSALAAGRPVEVTVDSLTASALGARRTGPLNLAVAQAFVDAVCLVTDDEILAARDLLWDEARIAVEPAGAAGLAALLAGVVEAENPAVILCGANSSWVPG
jgi:threonine dehydratase